MSNHFTNIVWNILFFARLLFLVSYSFISLTFPLEHIFFVQIGKAFGGIGPCGDWRYWGIWSIWWRVLEVLGGVWDGSRGYFAHLGVIGVFVNLAWLE